MTRSLELEETDPSEGVVSGLRAGDTKKFEEEVGSIDGFKLGGGDAKTGVPLGEFGNAVGVGFEVEFEDGT